MPHTARSARSRKGLPGFSVAALDGGCVSWQFKPLDARWPFVLITRPADGRQGTALSDKADPSVSGGELVWQVTLAAVPGTVIVEARDGAGRSDRDRIETAQDGAASRETAADGSDKDGVDARPSKGIVGGQLGPNRNGRKW